MSLKLIEHGVYRVLMDHYYANGSLVFSYYSSKKDIIERIYTICRANTEEEKNAVNFVLFSFFTEVEGGFIHKKCDQIIREQKEKHEKRVNSGKQKTKPKTQEENNEITLDQCSRNAEAMLKQCSSNTPQKKKKNKNNYKKDISNDISKEEAPECVDAHLWKNYLDLRSTIGAKNTELAVGMLKKKLESFSEMGYSANEIVQDAILHGWKSFYQPKALLKKTTNQQHLKRYSDGDF